MGSVSVFIPLNDVSQSRSVDNSPSIAGTEDSSDMKSFSRQSINTEIGFDVKNSSKFERKKTRMNSAYIKNYRFSRYNNALSLFLPFLQRPHTSEKELPLACFPNITFSWIQNYRITKDMLEKQANLPDHLVSLPANTDRFLLLKTSYSDSAEVNGKRLLGIFRDEEQTNGSNASMLRVAWKFCRTRILIVSFIHMLAILFGLLGPVIFLKLSLDSIQHEIGCLNELRNITNPSGINGEGASVTLQPFKSVFQTQAQTVHYFVNNHHAHYHGNMSDHTLNILSAPNDVYNSFMRDHVTMMRMFIEENFMHQSNLSESDKMAMETFMQLQNEVEIQKLNRVGFSMGIFLCFLSMIFLENIIKWLNLRTGIRLTTACLVSAFKKTMKSTMYNTLGDQQNLLQCYARSERDVILAFVQNGSFIFGSIVGTLISVAIAISLLSLPGLWPFFGIVGLFVLAGLLAFISSHYQRKALNNTTNKLNLIGDVYLNFKKINTLGTHESIKIQFDEIIENEYSNHLWSEVFGAHLATATTASILLGALYLIWCDVNIITETIPVLILIIVYGYFVNLMVHEFFVAIGSILNGKASLDNLKQTLTRPSTKITKSKPQRDLVFSLQNAQFNWNNSPKASMQSIKRTNRMSIPHITPNFTLFITDLTVETNKTIGITGVRGCGKSTLLYSMLGHTDLIKGEIKQIGKCSLCPQTPVMYPGTLRENITFGNPFDPLRYYKVLSVVNLGDDRCLAAETDTLPIESINLTLSHVEKINIARALYANQSTILLDNPLGHSKDEHEVSEIMKNILQFAASFRITVVVATQQQAILSQCSKIYLLHDGQISDCGTHEGLLLVPGYCRTLIENKNMLSTYDEETLQAHNETILIQSNISIYNSSVHQRNESSVYNALEVPSMKRSTYFPICRLAMMLIINIINNIGYFILPFAFVAIVKLMLIEPLLSFVSIGVTAGSFLLDLKRKIIFGNAAKYLAIKYQIKMFETYLRRSVQQLYDKTRSETTLLYADNLFAVIRPYSNALENITVIMLSSILLTYTNYWTIFVPILAMGFNIAVFNYYKYTVIHFCSLEMKTLSKVSVYMASSFNGRNVIQSMDKIWEISREFYNHAEENAMALFMRKSTVFYAQFLQNVFLAFGFWATCLILLLTPISSLSIYRYVLGVFLYLTMSHNFNLLLENMFEKVVMHQRLENVENYIITPSTLPRTSL